MASARHLTSLPWQVGLPAEAARFEDDVWELYNLEADFSQARNLAGEMPGKLQAMKNVFRREAQRVGILPLRNALVEMRRAPLPTLRDGRSVYTYYEGAVGIPETSAPDIFNRSWQLDATVQVAQRRARGAIATMGGTVSGWSLYLDERGRPVFEYRLFEVDSIRIRGRRPLGEGEHRLTLNFAYDGGGYARGGVFTLKTGDQVLGEQRISATPPAYFSIDETFDIGLDSGSPAGRYPAGRRGIAIEKMIGFGLPKRLISPGRQ